MTELPRFHRLLLRVMVGSLKMLIGQLRELPLELRERVGLPDPVEVQGWLLSTENLHGSTVDAEPAPARVTTTGNNDPAPVPVA
jgi:hypothetical protein